MRARSERTHSCQPADLPSLQPRPSSPTHPSKQPKAQQATTKRIPYPSLPFLPSPTARSCPSEPIPSHLIPSRHIILTTSPSPFHQTTIALPTLPPYLPTHLPTDLPRKPNPLLSSQIRRITSLLLIPSHPFASHPIAAAVEPLSSHLSATYLRSPKAGAALKKVGGQEGRRSRTWEVYLGVQMQMQTGMGSMGMRSGGSSLGMRRVRRCVCCVTFDLR